MCELLPPRFIQRMFVLITVHCTSSKPYVLCFVNSFYFTVVVGDLVEERSQEEAQHLVGAANRQAVSGGE